MTHDGRSCRWPRPVVLTDPGVNGGRPCISGAPVSVVAGRVAAGEPLSEVADDYGLTRREALTACWYAAAHDDGWAGWAQEWVGAAWAGLGTAPDDDTVCEAIPDPPPLTEQDDHAPVLTTIDVIGDLPVTLPVDPLSAMCPACLADPGDPCYATSSDEPRRIPHRLRGLAAAKRLEPCPHCKAIGWIPTTSAQDAG